VVSSSVFRMQNLVTNLDDKLISACTSISSRNTEKTPWSSRSLFYLLPLKIDANKTSYFRLHATISSRQWLRTALSAFCCKSKIGIMETSCWTTKATLFILVIQKFPSKLLASLYFSRFWLHVRELPWWKSWL
jgi:hypothetical protein